ncbi:iron-containing alcohol dehydrogenase [Vibrio sp. JC009]|uniref:1-propanol dehydrogenase PduQ n=1 Tax=Vibrio sp. JC009 TaxID=2912314 RepID=UPI0023AEFEAF|nr:1-propanol dehydrogenase PduQ [Vibrio sp. JC009]WED21103.1 iron-containing alcohol dehydrogenase [Vibrio sp. JC009]
MTQFYGKTKVCYGKNAMDNLHKLPGKDVFIVTDGFIAKTGFVDQVKSHLSKGVTSTIFDKVEADPSLDTITAATHLFMKSGSNAIIAIGGGSAIDAAKAVAYFATQADSVRQPPYLVAIPTTSGTGSEVTSISVVTDKKKGIKIPLQDETLTPDLAILDARFTRTMPPSITAATGMDVLTHAIEAYVSNRANLFTSIYAENAIKIVFKYLPRAYASGEDMEAREQLLLASCMAGMAFNNSGLGITHSVAHSLGGLFHIPHGIANAVLLPSVIEFNSFDACIQYQKLASFLGLPASSMDEGTSSFLEAIRQLNASLDIPCRISGLDINENEYVSNIPTMTNNILHDICTVTNPKKASYDDVIQLLRKAW